MKLNLIILLIALSFSSCKKDLNSIEFNDNPYDAAYVGSKVVEITNVSFNSNPNGDYNQINISVTHPQYSYVVLFRNGILWKTIVRNGYVKTQNAFQEVILDSNISHGITYSYTVALKNDDALTQQSDAKLFTTP